MNPAFDSLKRVPAKPEEDTPPGTEGTYVSGPLAIQKPPPKPKY